MCPRIKVTYLLLCISEHMQREWTRQKPNLRCAEGDTVRLQLWGSNKTRIKLPHGSNCLQQAGAAMSQPAQLPTCSHQSVPMSMTRTHLCGLLAHRHRDHSACKLQQHGTQRLCRLLITTAATTRLTYMKPKHTKRNAIASFAKLAQCLWCKLLCKTGSPHASMGAAR